MAPFLMIITVKHLIKQFGITGPLWRTSTSNQLFSSQRAMQRFYICCNGSQNELVNKSRCRGFKTLMWRYCDAIMISNCYSINGLKNAWYVMFYKDVVYHV